MGEKMDTLFSKFMIFFIALFGMLFLFSLIIFINNFITYEYSFSENLNSFKNLAVFGVFLLIGINFEKIVSYLEASWN